jgi:polyhydroxyalkanoate synthesis regulator phasin
VANGEITPSEASSLMNAISSQARIIEVDELERRVSELENRNESK